MPPKKDISGPRNVFATEIILAWIIMVQLNVLKNPKVAYIRCFWDKVCVFI